MVLKRYAEQIIQKRRDSFEQHETIYSFLAKKARKLHLSEDGSHKHTKPTFATINTYIPEYKNLVVLKTGDQSAPRHKRWPQIQFQSASDLNGCDDGSKKAIYPTTKKKY